MTQMYSLRLIPLCTPLLAFPYFILCIRDLKLLLKVLFYFVFPQSICVRVIILSTSNCRGKYLVSLDLMLVSHFIVVVLFFFRFKDFALNCFHSSTF